MDWETKYKELEARFQAVEAKLVAAEQRAVKAEGLYQAAIEDNRKAQVTARKAQGERAVETAITEGRLAPVAKDNMVAVAHQLAEQDATVTFSQGGQQKTGHPVDAFCASMAAMPKVVAFGIEQANSTPQPGDTSKKPANEIAHERAIEYQGKHQGVTYEVALDNVLAADPELKRDYGSYTARQ